MKKLQERRVSLAVHAATIELEEQPQKKKSARRALFVGQASGLSLSESFDAELFPVGGGQNRAESRKTLQRPLRSAKMHIAYYKNAV